MGIARKDIAVLMKEGLRRPFQGKVLTLGHQFVYATREEVETLAAIYGYPLRMAEAEYELSQSVELGAKGYISQRTLFQALGFDAVLAMDYSAYEEPEIIHDLNDPEPPQAWRGAFDLIYDGGTLEHIFNVPNALACLHHLTAPGGRIMHLTPSSNHIDHGMYMMCPTMYWDYYSANGYGVPTMQVFRYTENHASDPAWYADYYPGAMDGISYGRAGQGNDMYAIVCVAEKRPNATFGKPVMQGVYRPMWVKTAPGGNEILTQVRTVVASPEFRIRVMRAKGPLAVYGAGGHTQELLRALEEASMPRPAYILTTDTPKEAEFEGLRVLKASEAAAGAVEKPGLVLISSRLYATQMCVAAKLLFPEASQVTFWPEEGAARLRKNLADPGVRRRIAEAGAGLAACGADAHTLELLDALRELGLPKPAYLLTIKRTGVAELEGVPVREASEAAASGMSPSLILVPRTHNEKDVRRTMARLFPGARRLTFS